MRTQFRLNSVVTHGVGSGPESLAIDLIYEFLLHEFGQDIYKQIVINQIADNLTEFVMKEPGNKIHINIRYRAYEDFEFRSNAEKNRIRLDVIHTSLLRVAEQEKKFDIKKLEAIKNKILDNDFSFEFLCRSFVNKKFANLVAKIIVNPRIDKFDYFVLIEEEQITKCKIHIYSGKPGILITEFFFYCKWKSSNELLIWGKEKVVQTQIFVDKCTFNIINLSPYDYPPYYTIMKADVSKEEMEYAFKCWLHSLPPNIAAGIRENLN
jgi:hypothetical protein